MHTVDRDMICIGIKYSVKIEAMYFEWDKFIPTLEKHFPDIPQEILDHVDQRYNSEQGRSVPTGSSDNNTDFRHDHTGRQHTDRPPSPNFCDQEPEVSVNTVAAFTIVHWSK